MFLFATTAGLVFFWQMSSQVKWERREEGEKNWKAVCLVADPDPSSRFFFRRNWVKPKERWKYLGEGKKWLLLFHKSRRREKNISFPFFPFPRTIFFFSFFQVGMSSMGYGYIVFFSWWSDTIQRTYFIFLIPLGCSLRKPDQDKKQKLVCLRVNVEAAICLGGGGGVIYYGMNNPAQFSLNGQHT